MTQATAEAHVAVVDDHADIRRLVGTHLKRFGFDVTLAEDAAAYRAAAMKARFDLVLLDVMMPGTDGLALCREIRARSEVPVLFMTALGEETDRIVGLELGADDYVCKPFNPRELVARIKAVLRRTNALPPALETPAAERVAFAGRVFDLARRQVSMPDGRVVPLSTAEYKVLRAFVEHPGAVLSRDQILDLTRGKSADVFLRAVDNQVSRLRRKIEDEPSEPRIILTHWGGGYCLAPEVTPLEGTPS